MLMMTTTPPHPTDNPIPHHSEPPRIKLLAAALLMRENQVVDADAEGIARRKSRERKSPEAMYAYTAEKEKDS